MNFTPCDPPVMKRSLDEYKRLLDEFVDSKESNVEVLDYGNLKPQSVALTYRKCLLLDDKYSDIKVVTKLGKIFLRKV